MTNASRLLSVLLVCASAQGVMSQSPGQVAEEEAIRRQEKTIVLRDALNSANQQQKQGDLGAAAKTYEQAWGLVEQLGTTVEAERTQTVQGFTSVYMELVVRSLKEGDYKEADARLKRVLAVDPNHTLAKRLKRENDERLEGMKGRTPSDKALESIGDKRKEMIEAGTHEHNGQLFFELGKLEEAAAEFKEAMKINPDSRAAHHYLAAIEERLYSRAAAKRELASKGALVEVERDWATELPKLPEANPYATTNTVRTSRGRQVIYNKLDRIRLNELKFEGLPLSEVVKTLEEQSRLRDPEKKGINFIISSSVDIPQAAPGGGAIDPTTGLPAPAAPVEPLDVSAVNVRLVPGLKDVRLADALDAITKVAERPIKVSVEDYAVIFTQRLPQAEQLFSRRYRVNPNTFYQGLESVIGLPLPIDSQGGGGGGAGGGGGGGGAGGGAGGGLGGQGGGLFTIPRVEVTMGGGGGIGGQGGGLGGGGGGLGGGGGGFGGGGGGLGGGGGGLGGGGGQGGSIGFGPGIGGVTRTQFMVSIQDVVRQFFIACGVNFPLSPLQLQQGGGLGGGGLGGGQGQFGGGLGGQGQFGGGQQSQDTKAMFFNDRTGILFVRATLSDLDIIEEAIQVLNVAPPQVQIEAKFAEVTQQDGRAIGFDWYLGNFLMNNGSMGLGGGTAPSLNTPGGTTEPRTSLANAEGTFPGNVASGTAIPAGASDGLLTSGVRNQDANQSAIPTIATFSGILTDPQFRLVIRALEQRDGVDLLSAPKVTTLSGRQAQISVVDARRIVLDVNQNQGGQQGGAGVVQPTGVGQVIQQNPIGFGYTTASLPFGPTLDVIPYVSADDVSIQMSIIPAYTEFIGYDNPGDFVPVQTGPNVAPVRARLPLPRIRLRQVTTSAIVWDGQTVVLGGLIAEDVKKTRDKVPVLGDIPFVGRLFRSEASLNAKKNLVIFVTPTIIDPAGKRVHPDDSLPFDPNTVPTQAAR